MADIDNKTNRIHTLIIDNGFKATGVINVEEYNEKRVVLKLSARVAIIEGDKLNVTQLDLDSGKVVATGIVNSLRYTGKSDKVPLLKRLLK